MGLEFVHFEKILTCTVVEKSLEALPDGTLQAQKLEDRNDVTVDTLGQ